MYANHQLHRVMHTTLTVPAAVVIYPSNYQSGIIKQPSVCKCIFIEKCRRLVDAEKINESTNVVSEICFSYSEIKIKMLLS